MIATHEGMWRRCRKMRSVVDKVCDICGNEWSAVTITCPFCGAKNHSTIKVPRPDGSHRIVNIEIGRPTVEEALAKLAGELERARSENLAAMTVIHGYGASGRGGAIRAECRKLLDHYQANRVIRSSIPGENFSKKAGATKALLRRLPQLASSGNLGKRNRGITVIEL